MQDVIKFCLLLVLEIPAFFLSILIFIYFITHRVDRSKPKNHVWFALLTVNFIQIIITSPMSLSFYYLGQVWPQTNTYCVWWTRLQYATIGISLTLMAWASIERYFLIFYPTFMLGALWNSRYSMFRDYST